jgi:hypothetical protein
VCPSRSATRVGTTLLLGSTVRHSSIADREVHVRSLERWHAVSRYQSRLSRYQSRGTRHDPPLISLSRLADIEVHVRSLERRHAAAPALRAPRNDDAVVELEPLTVTLYVGDIVPGARRLTRVVDKRNEAVLGGCGRSCARPRRCGGGSSLRLRIWIAVPREEKVERAR